MKRITTLLILFMAISSLIAQTNNAPVVSNVSFTQRTDGTCFVDIYYDVYDPEGNPLTILVFATENGGITWDYPITQVTGDWGTGIVSGTGKHIIWNFFSEHPNTFGDNYQIKVVAYDGYGNSPCMGLPVITYEGKTYNTVQIGTQCWLKENLDVGNMISGSSNQSNNGVIEKYCYNNDPNMCTTYGGLYQWDEMMQYTTYGNAVKGICPSGWHIPSDAEWTTLTTFLGATTVAGGKMKVIGTQYWQAPNTGATNESGFSALPGGYLHIHSTSRYFSSLGTQANIWSSSIHTTNLYSKYIVLSFNTTGASVVNDYLTNGLPVRCIKDN